MTQGIGVHGLHCLTENDYAAYALSIQCNAQAIEAALTGTQAQVASALDRPYMSATNIAQRTISGVGGGIVLPEDYVGDSMNWNFENFVSNDIPVYSFADPATRIPAGIYLMGVSIRWTVATPTNNSRRTLLLYGVAEESGTVDSTTTYKNLYFATDVEGSAAGNDGSLTAIGMLDATAGTMAFVESGFSHTNTGSDIIIPVGAWRVWMMYLGSGVES